MIRNRLHKTVAIASILFSITTPTVFAQQESETKAIVSSGNIAHDVMQVLIVLGKLDAVPGDPTSSLARSAITDAERRLGLPADGIADQELFDRLNAEALQDESRLASKSRFTLDDGKTLTAIIAGLGGLVLGFLKLRRSNGTKETKSA